MIKLEELKKRRNELANLEDNIKKGKIIDQNKLEDLTKKIDEITAGFSEIGYLDEVVEVYQTSYRIFIVASEVIKSEFQKGAISTAKIYKERAMREQASIELLPDKMATAETVRLSLAAQTSAQQAIKWLQKQFENLRDGTGGWGWFPEIYEYLSEDLKKHLKAPSLIRAWDTAMAIRALVAANEKSDSPMISKAINWLERNQNTDGGWGPFPEACKEKFQDCPFDRNTHDTSCVIIALLEAGKTLGFEPISKGINWLMASRMAGRDDFQNLPFPIWRDFLFVREDLEYFAKPTAAATSLALIALARVGNRQGYDSLLRVHPFGFRNPGRGWNVLGGRSATQESAYAIIALLEVEEDTSIIRDGLNWLKASQNEDGGWGWTRGHKECEIVPTALAILALLRGGESSRDIIVRKGVKWLLSKKKEDNWNSSTSLVILALHHFIESTEKDIGF